jgi:hypothetical protein
MPFVMILAVGIKSGSRSFAAKNGKQESKQAKQMQSFDRWEGNGTLQQKKDKEMRCGVSLSLSLYIYT